MKKIPMMQKAMARIYQVLYVEKTMGFQEKAIYLYIKYLQAMEILKKNG